MYLDIGSRTKIHELHIGLFVLLVSFFVRIYGYLFGTPNHLVFELTVFGAFVFALFSIVKMFRLKNCAYNPLLNVATLFWIWSCFSTMINMTDISSLLYDLVMQSFWFLFLLFFTYYSGDLHPQKMHFVIKICTAFMVVIGFIYIFWMFYGGNTLVSGALNSVYYCLLLLPVIFVQPNKFLMIFSAVVVFLAVLMSGKRAAFIAFVLALFIPILFLADKRKYKLNRILFLIFLMLLFIGIYYFITSIFNITLFERLAMLSEDGGSGRLDIYRQVLTGFKESSLVEKLFGHGFNGVAINRIVWSVDEWTGVTSTSSAHNDFLEVLYDYGLIGFLLYMLMIIRMLKFAFHLRKKNFDCFKMYLCALIIFITMSLFSHLIIYPTYTTFLFIFLSWGVNCAKKGGKV